MQKNKIWIAVSVILLIIVGILAYNLNKQKQQYAIVKENDYNMAFYEVVDYVQNVKTYLAKAMISKSAEHGAEILTHVWKEANLAQTYLGMLPIESQELENTEKFLNQVSEYSYTLSRKNIEGDGLTDDDTLIDDDSADSEETAEDVVDEYAENPLSPVIDKVLSESEWPALSIVTDETILKEFFLLDPADYKEMIVMQCPISAKMSEIIIVNSDDISAAEEALNARRQKAIDQDAWYPNDVELAQNSIVGTNGSYAYFIIGDNAEAAEASINSYFDAL